MPDGIDDGVQFNPDLGGASSSRLGHDKREKSRQMASLSSQYVQQEIDWNTATVSGAEKMIPPAQELTLPQSPPDSPALACSIRDAVERLLQKRRITYIDVDDAKRILFNGTELRCFHFVVYHPAGPNWLLFCGNPEPSDRDDLAEWQRIFGEGFVPVIAKRHADQSLHFESLCGCAVTLD